MISYVTHRSLSHPLVIAVLGQRMVLLTWMDVLLHPPCTVSSIHPCAV